MLSRGAAALSGFLNWHFKVARCSGTIRLSYITCIVGTHIKQRYQRYRIALPIIKKAHSKPLRTATIRRSALGEGGKRRQDGGRERSLPGFSPSDNLPRIPPCDYLPTGTAPPEELAPVRDPAKSVPIPTKPYTS